VPGGEGHRESTARSPALYPRLMGQSPAEAEPSVSILDERFQIIRVLGRGGTGSVYRANDREMGTEIALKVLHASDDALRLKSEFRSLADVTHPNLVELYELFVQPTRSFFTMELIAGSHVDQYVRGSAERPAIETRTWTMDRGADDSAAVSPAPGLTESTRAADLLDLDRLRGVLHQLGTALAHLHAANKLHRDIKPSNVLVAPSGRLVVVDFGLALQEGGRLRPSNRFAGTPAYMAPEQHRGEKLSPATDCYAVGALLYQLLTGKLPFTGDSERLLRAKDTGNVVRPSALCAVPKDLEELTLALLHPLPAERPSAPDIAAVAKTARLSKRAPAAPPGWRQPAHFVGREHEVSTLRRAFDEIRSGRIVVATVGGPSGIGKSELCRRVTENVAEESSAIVLASRCLPYEIVPYKAFDGIVDSLVQLMAALSQEEAGSLIPDGAGALVRVFPALAGVPAFAHARLLTPGEPRELRRVAFRAFRDLLRMVSARAPLVLFIDDLQWGDTDSALLLHELLRPPGDVRVLVILAYRTEESDRSEALARFNEILERAPPSQRVHLEIGPLPSAESLKLAHELLGDGMSRYACAVAQESLGSPFFIGALVRHIFESGAEGTNEAADVQLADVLQRRAMKLSPSELRLIQLAAVAGGPVERSVLMAAGGHGERARPEVARLARGALLRTTELRTRAAVECYHDRFRETIMRQLEPALRRQLHLDLAHALERCVEPDPESLARHFLGGGETEKGAQQALLAATAASSALAFERAVQLYRLALHHSPALGRDSSVHKQLAQALLNAGRFAEAAESFERAASFAQAAGFSAAELVELRRRAGESYIRSGRISAGMKALDVALAAFGIRMPATRLQELRRMMYWRSRLIARGTSFGPTDVLHVPPSELAKLDVLWGASTSVSMFNHLLADALGVQFLYAALQIGESSRILRGLGYEAAFVSILGGPFFERTARRLLTEMDALAATSNSTYDRGWAAMARGIVAWFRADWTEAVRLCQLAADFYRAPACVGTNWEVAICNAYVLPALAYLGRLRQLRAVCTDALDAAERRDDLFVENTCRLGQQNLIWLVDDRPEEALAHAKAAVAPFPSDRFLIPHYHYAFAACQIALYRGDGRAAADQIEADWPKLRSSHLLRAQTVRAELNHLRGRAALMLASQSRSAPARRKNLARVREAVSRLEQDRNPLGAPFAAALRAGSCVLAGEWRAAQSLLAAAESGFARSRMELYRVASVYAAGLVPGSTDASRRRVDQALEWAALEGIKTPPALFRMLLPGCC
jgi:eukaryotic-like serine/threonine-protein kinase